MTTRMLMFLAAVSCSAALCGAQVVRPTEPPSLAVLAGADSAKLAIDPPLIQDGKVKGKTPADWAKHYEAWDPWPGAPKNAPPATLNLVPKTDAQDTLILGYLYKSVLPESVILTTADGSKTFKVDEDFKLNTKWGQIAGIDGRLGKPGEGELQATYRYATQRLDLVQQGADGKVTLKRGEPAIVCPALPAPDAGAKALAGIYVAPWKQGGDFVITAADIFPISPAEPSAPINPQALTKAMKKLGAGEEVKIAFLGDSITLGAEAPKWWDNLWTDKNLGYPSRVVTHLRRQFPKARITPIAAFKGATGTKQAPAMFDANVASAKPDLVVIAFGANDAHGPVGQPPSTPVDEFRKNLLGLISKARLASAEVLLVTPLQTAPWLANKQSERLADYRKAIIEVAESEKVACADVYTDWINQARSGVPPFSQLHNMNNHPGAAGHAVYANTITRLFDAAGK